MNRQNRGFLEQWNSSLIRQQRVRVITRLFQPTACPAPRVNPHVNDGLRVMMTCHRRFAGCVR